MARKPIPLPPGTGPKVKAPKAISGNKPTVKPTTKPTVKPKAPRGSDEAIGSHGVQKRAQNRLSRIIARGGTAPTGVKAGKPMTLGQARAIKAEILRLNAARRNAAKAKSGAEPFDPLAPVTGKNFKDELAAATRGQFGESDRALGNAYDNNTHGTEISNSYWDQYKQELADATKRINDKNTELIGQGQTQVDSAFTQDTAAAKAREDAQKAQQDTLGLQHNVSTEGTQQAEAMRSQGNSTVQADRSVAGTTNTLMENRGSSAVQAKAEAYNRAQAARGKLDEDARKLAADKGDFATTYRGKIRDSERQWAAIQEEFGLKKADQAAKNKTSAADRKLEASKLETQKIVARIYAAADKAGARAQIRVAQLQLAKGKIDQHQYNTIVNEYKGLPKKGVSPQAKPKTPGPKFQNWEIDKIDNAQRILTKNKVGITPGDKAKWIDNMQKEGLSARVARAAWAKYEKAYKSDLRNQNRPH